MTDTLSAIPFARADGSAATLADYAGQVRLIVNVASKCGLTPQYDGLEALHRTYGARGLEILGFPANDFAGQEPGSDAEIQEFCRLTYGVEFPVFAKISVKGAAKHPLYRHLTAAMPQASFKADSALRQRLEARGMAGDSGEVTWNFEKFLISRDGRVVARFAPDTAPQDAEMLAAIERELAARP